MPLPPMAPSLQLIRMINSKELHLHGKFYQTPSKEKDMIGSFGRKPSRRM